MEKGWSGQNWVGVDRIGKSGRKPLFLSVEKELVKFSTTVRSHGIIITNRITLSEVRKYPIG